jgi:DNA-binding transcriptional ArsR family regulator
MSLGQEVGRVLSDGRIVGRAEPYAKVFPSSRAVKRAVGLVAWAVLEDIALDARLDDQGRLVAETNVRRIAANLGIGKNAVSRHLANLRDYGFVLHEELRDSQSGRYEISRYVLDPSACIERFTHTPVADAKGPGAPSRGGGASSQLASPPPPRARDMARPLSPCPPDEDTGHGPASPPTGHREGGQKNKRTAVVQDEQQPRDGGDSSGLAQRLAAVGVDVAAAEALVAHHPADLVTAALRAVRRRGVRRPAGFVVSALRDGWDLSAELAEERAEQTRRRRAADEARAAERACAEAERQRVYADGWAAAVSAALDDSGLVAAVLQVTKLVAGAERRSVPVARAQLLLWAAAAAGRHPGLALSAALRRELDAGPHLPDPAPLPEPPASERSAPDLSGRLAACLRDTTFPAPVATRGASR